MNNYETVVGLEIHAHLKTESKMFCSCSTGPRGKEYKASEKDKPNVRICPVCSGQPGTLPVPNIKAIKDTILLGLALGSEIPKGFNFERKNYYYPDLPKAYQITSATNPPVVGGGLEIDIMSPSTHDARLGQVDSSSHPTGSGKVSGSKFINLDHIHLEEDAGKLTHDKSGEFSLVDLNRAGTPLLEIITKPVLSSGEEAAAFMKNLQSILRALGVSDADMEKGQMRCDANISVRKLGNKELGAKVEVKNINSFKMVQKAIDYETTRQIEVLNDGGKISQETRGWDDNKGKTTSQRSKEFANDYRYFPEPDIPPFLMGPGMMIDPKEIISRLPELPKEKENRFIKEYGLTGSEAKSLAENLDTSRYFEEVIGMIPEAAEGSDFARKVGRLVAGFLMNDFLGRITEYENIYESPVSAESFSELIGLLYRREITGKIAKDIIPKMIKEGKTAAEVISLEGIKVLSENEVKNIVMTVIQENPSQVSDYRKGNEKIFGFFIGQVMKKTNGMADPATVNDFLKKELVGN